MARSYLSNLVRRLTEDREQWKIDHDEVMQHYKTAENLAAAASLYLHVLSQVEKSAEPPPRESFHKMNLSWADSLCELHEIWYSIASDLLANVEASEERNFAVDRSCELREAVQRVGEMLPEMKRLRGRIKDIRTGKCVPLRNALDGMGSMCSSRRK